MTKSIKQLPLYVSLGNEAFYKIENRSTYTMIMVKRDGKTWDAWCTRTINGWDLITKMIEEPQFKEITVQEFEAMKQKYLNFQKELIAVG